MSVATIAALECCYQCRDPSIRSICISALTQLVVENGKIFKGDDQQTAIWNLFFSLNSVDMGVRATPDRIVTIKALGVLGHIYSGDLGLAHHIIDGLLRLPTKVYMAS
jgi:hypothetical protein